jgi:hypothetical protein
MSDLHAPSTSILVTTGRLLYPPGAAEVGTNLRPDLARPVELSVARRASSSHASALLVDQRWHEQATWRRVKAAGPPRRMTWVEGARGASRAAGHSNSKGRP